MKIRNTLDHQLEVVSRYYTALTNEYESGYWTSPVTSDLVRTLAKQRVKRIKAMIENKKLKQQFNTVKNIAQDAIALVKELQDNELKEI